MSPEQEDISMLAEIETSPAEVSVDELNEELPVMTLRNLVLFPTYFPWDSLLYVGFGRLNYKGLSFFYSIEI